MIIVTDITILFSDLVSLIVPLQTWNVKYYKYAIIKNGLKSLMRENLIFHFEVGVAHDHRSHTMNHGSTWCKKYLSVYCFVI